MVLDIRSKSVDYLQLIFIVLAFILILFAGVFASEHIVTINQGTMTESWTPTNGTMIAYLSDEVVDGQTYYQPHAFYTYEVNQTQYYNNVISVNDDFSDWRSTDRTIAVEQLRGYENNTAVTVYYYPATPSSSVLQPGVPPSTRFYL